MESGDNGSLSANEIIKEPPDPTIQLNRVLLTQPQHMYSDESTPKFCEYLGSFPANQDELKLRIEYVETQVNLLSQKRLDVMKKQRENNLEVEEGRQVALVLSFSGLRVCSLDLAHTYKVVLQKCCKNGQKWLKMAENG